MIKAFTDFLRSGHQFSDDDNLQRFRFGFFNVLMAIAMVFTFINFLASFFAVIDFGKVFENATLIYVISSIVAIFLLRRKKSFYPYVVTFFIISSLVLFYFVLLTRQEDEFRLIAFFLALFITNVLLGRIYGLWLALMIVVSIFILSKKYNLELSQFAFSTFFTFFISFAAILYFFLGKVENDAKEFKVLNLKLKKNIAKEKQQREEQEQMLLRQCRMANMGVMIDSIAHQWRQPLMHINSILMNMDSALKDKEKK